MGESSSDDEGSDASGVETCSDASSSDASGVETSSDASGVEACPSLPSLTDSSEEDSDEDDSDDQESIAGIHPEAGPRCDSTDHSDEDDSVDPQSTTGINPEAGPRCDSEGESSSSSATELSDSGKGCAVNSSCSAQGMCTEFVKETWVEHLRIHGPHHQCPRCRFMRSRDKYEAALTYDCGNGETGTWIEQVCTAEHAWGLGCKICRWAQKDSAFARGEIRCNRGTTISSLRRHANRNKCRAHVEALEDMRKKSEEASSQAGKQAPEAAPHGPRDDVPSLPHFYAAYKIAKKGQSFQSYEADVETMRAGGAPLKKSRGSRFVCKNMIECEAEELSWEDSMLLRKCSDVALTMDGRKGMLVVRVRLTMGHGMPKGFTPESLGGKSPAIAPGATDREITGIHGKYIHTVDRVISLRQEQAFDDTPALARHLVDSLREACQSEDVWQRVRRRVRVCCPDGAPNEQLAARLATEEFENMKFVVRCGAHGAHGAVKTAWRTDEQVSDVTHTMQEVGKFLRSSSRFELRFGSKAREEAVEAVLNFDFAPQRFCSKERPMTRGVHFARSVMLVLGLEVAAPTSPERRKWAQALVQKMDGPFWMLLGMLADLAEDCAIFIRKFDEKYLDAMSFQAHLARFLEYLSREYVQGGMWLRPASTYSAKIAEMLETTSTLSFGEGYLVVSPPTKAQTRQCIAKVANVAAALQAALNAEFPNFSVQRLLSAFELNGDTPAPSQIERLRKIIDLLGWPLAERRACLHEFADAFKKAHKEKQAKGVCDRDAWAKVVAVDKSKATMKRLICMALGFLLTETECERNFAEERRAHEGRPRLLPKTRFHGLKVMLDGLPFERLQQGGEPVGDFWRKCQDRYAEKFGVRRLGDRETRKDKGTTRAGTPKTLAKRTVTGFKRERAKALHEETPIPFGSAPEARPRTVFGHKEMKRQTLEDLRQQEETTKYREMLDKMEAKLEKKREEYNKVLSGDLPSLAQLAPAKRRKVISKSQKVRRAISALGFSGFRSVNSRQFLRALQGTPSVFLQDGVTDSLPGRGLDEEYWGKPLRSLVFTDGIKAYVQTRRDLPRRIILVSSLSSIPDYLRLAAVFVGARVQEEMLVPALHFAPLMRHTIACTEHFQRKNVNIMAVIRGAAARAYVPGTARITLRKPAQLAAAYDALKEKSKARQRKWWTLLYENVQDVEVANVSDEVKQVSRTLSEFMQICVRMHRPETG